MKITSFMFGSNARTMRKKSASAVDDETKSFAAIGPVISVGCSSGGMRNVTPSERPR